MKGNPYSYNELVHVFSIYEKVKFSIHKSNIRIIELGQTLGRDTRSVENQLLMFRAYEKEKLGVIYSRKNYNKLVPEVYENHIKTMNVMTFPDRFRKFQKSEKSSVSKISDIFSSGSPIQLINTPLHSFIDRVITDQLFLKRKNIIALVGGAGNGKTESLGYILNQIKDNFGLFQDQQKLQNNIELSLTSNKGYFTTFDDKGFRLSFIQDATSVWSENDIFLSKKESINRSISEAFEGCNNGLLVICVNRGVLSDLLRELDGEPLEIITVLNEQTSIKGYLKSISNVWADFMDYSISSYPLDKMRLFEGDGVHTKFVEQMKSVVWSSQDSKSHFSTSQYVIGSLLDALELKKSGLLTFRDYLNYLSLLFSPVHNDGWMNIPSVKIWFGNQFDTVSDVFANVISKSPHAHFSNSLNALLRGRENNSELMELDFFDPLKVSELINADDVQVLLDSLTPANDFQIAEFSIKEKTYNIYGYYNQLLKILGSLDEWIDKHTTEYSSDNYRVKRYLFNLTAQLMSFIVFENDHIFYLSEEKKIFLNSSSEDAIDLLASSLDLKKSLRSESFVICTQSIVDELWVHKEKPTVSQEINLNISFEEIKTVVIDKPKISHRIFNVKDNESIKEFQVMVDFTQYCTLLMYKGDLKIYHENYSVSFSIWVNSIKEKLREYTTSNSGLIEIFGFNVNVNRQL